ncbi:MAG: ThiF family adenylyltransferase [Candidatus Magasanikbacteria bacterium]
MNIHKDKPSIFREGEYKNEDLQHFSKTHQISRVINVYRQQLIEIFFILNPQYKKADNRKELFNRFLRSRRSFGRFPGGNWIYYPWNGYLVHMVTEQDYYTLVTNRNRELVTPEEQKKLVNFVVGIAGLSVGSHVATCLAQSGISWKMNLAEYDILDTTNLNRMRAKLFDLQNNKIDIVAQSIWETNPYISFEKFSKGIDPSNIQNFLCGKQKVHLVFEIIDNFEMKIVLRKKARELGIPVISFASLGDSILLDIERYDLDPHLEIFNGRSREAVRQIELYPDLNDHLKNKYAVELVGKENIPARAIESVKEIGHTLSGRPQLMSTVTIAGGIAAYLTRRIALGEPVKSGRTHVKFSDCFL